MCAQVCERARREGAMDGEGSREEEGEAKAFAGRDVAPFSSPAGPPAQRILGEGVGGGEAGARA